MADESVFIVDIGSSSVKAGFSGEDIPSYVFPSAMTKIPQKHEESIEAWMGDNVTTVPGSALFSSHAVQRGTVQNWDQLKELWDHIKHVSNLYNIENTSIFVIESVRWTLEDRANMAKLLFDVDHAPSICFGNSASLSIFASGRTTGLAVECGAGLTASIPVFEGLVLRHAVTEMEYGGQDITNLLRKLFIDRNINIDFPSTKIVKERYAFVRGYSSPNDEQTCCENMTFSLPDGTDVRVDTAIFQSCTDSLFYSNSKSHAEAAAGLVPQVQESLLLCDDSIRRELANNIILSGGTSMLPGLGDRLNDDLTSRLAARLDARSQTLAGHIRVVPNSRYREPGYTLQRKHAAWIGGSLMSSFETYHKTLKISRQEWEENHEEILSLKCI
jgi:actin